MPSRRTVLATTTAVGAGAASWVLARNRDRSAVAADPECVLLVDPPGGRAQTVVSHDGTELHVEIFGPEGAPTLILAHGWTCRIAFWTRQIQTLSTHLRVVAYDQRGHGKSGRAGEAGYAIEAFGNDLAAVLEACVPDGERAVVAGHSLGGMSIVAYAGLHAGEVEQRLAGAALVDTGMGDLISETLIVRTPGFLGKGRQVIGSAVLSAPLPLPRGSSPVAHRAVKYIALSPNASPAQVAFSEQLVAHTRPDVRGAIGAALSRMNLHAAVERLVVPTVVIVGALDKLTPPKHGDRMVEALPNPRPLVVLPTGHMGPIEAADAVSDTLAELVASTVGAPSAT